MDFDTTEKYVRQILTLEFDDRDQEIQANIISVKSGKQRGQVFHYHIPLP